MIVGVDFDNTLVGYDEVIHREAVRLGLVPIGMVKSKQKIRDQIRQLPEGEIQWRKLQRIVYGPRMDEARLAEGVQAFFRGCVQRKVQVYVISHKTEYASSDETGINLRKAAMAWMHTQSFFKRNGLGLSSSDVYFESTRREKIERIRQLGCTHFIDDLEETFQEETFPGDVKKVLYAPHGLCSSLPGIAVFATWQDICVFLFNGRR